MEAEIGEQDEFAKQAILKLRGEVDEQTAKTEKAAAEAERKRKELKKRID